ncbi:MAG: valine--tRNA ligase [Balneolaceae bacterium]
MPNSRQRELPKQYDPSKTEPKWYRWWEENGFFHSEPDEREPYSVVIPPPNVTGVLHMGHMLNNTIQDVLVRRARMMGRNTCWVPGTDHASIATEAKVVRRLRERGISKADLSREEFIDHAWEWTEEHGGIILQQLRKLGASCDWERTRFTMEEELSESVTECFIELHRQGYIYRGLRMINWDPEAKTALSDEEVIHKDVQSNLYHIRYDVKGSDSGIVIATTRPETILADTAICVHPDDPRFSEFAGGTAVVPLAGREIPIIADDYVDPEYGTGCLKVTPAHDVNDYEIGLRHNLEVIDMLNADGTLSGVAGRFAGQDRFDARKSIIKDLKDEDRLEHTEEISNKVGYSERTDAVIEPRLSLQWFCRMEKLAGPALKSVMDGEVMFHPEKFKNTYRHWMENIRDWCISRQLWWGHRIPAWYYGDGDEEYVIARTPKEAIGLATEKAGRNITEEDIHQDEDVLDTWFSSWLWPMTVFGGLKDPENREIRYYYPTNDLVTAPEIMFFWVARMIMAGYFFRGQQPFSNVYYHGIVRDSQRRKMSKSLGNSPDPLELIEKYGADGTRAGMLFSSPAGNDLLFDPALCEQGRNFSNKIWNAFRFLHMNMDGQNPPAPDHSPPPSGDAAEAWIDSRIEQTIAAMNEDFDRYRLNEALQKIYSLVWDDFCDWYIEVIKSDQPGEKIPRERLARALGHFEKLVRLLHPFMPFITEEIWQQIAPRNTKEALIISDWPANNPDRIDKEAIRRFRDVQQITSAIRNIQAEMSLSPKKELTLLLRPQDKQRETELNEMKWVFRKLLPVARLAADCNASKPPACASAMIGQTELWIPLEGIIDLERERSRITKEIENAEGFLHSVRKKLSNRQFVENAPDAVVERERQKERDAESNLGKLKMTLSEIDHPSS